jgi:hypothetical protein
MCLFLFHQPELYLATNNDVLPTTAKAGTLVEGAGSCEVFDASSGAASTIVVEAARASSPAAPVWRWRRRRLRCAELRQRWRSCVSHSRQRENCYTGDFRRQLHIRGQVLQVWWGRSLLKPVHREGGLSSERHQHRRTTGLFTICKL